VHVTYFCNTLGGLLVILPKEKAADFCADMLVQDNRPAWIVGSVVPGTRMARIADDVKITEVPEVDRVNELW